MLVTLRVKGLNLMLQSTLQGKMFANPCKMIEKNLYHTFLCFKAPYFAENMVITEFCKA